MYPFVRAPRAAVLVAAVFALVAASACGSGAEPSGQGQRATEGAQGQDAAQPSGPQELTVGAAEDGYDREEPEANIGMYPLNANVFETLVRMTPEYEIEPMLASEWEFVEPNTWRFTLRDDVTFHDGSALTAKDVKYTIDRVAEQGGGTLRVDEKSAKVVDDHTVEITPSVQNRRLVEQLVHPEHSIIKVGTKVADEQMGTGPFKLVDYVEQEQLVVERNDDYWGEAPMVDQITFRFLPEPNARRLALEAGDVDVMLQTPFEMAGALETAGFVVAAPEVGITEAMYANINPDKASPALQDVNVRKAIAHAIDRDALVNQIFEGYGEAEQTFTPARLLADAAATIEGYPHDPEQARQLLDEAGWAEGPDGIREKDREPLTLTLVSGFPTAQVHGAVPEFLQAQLKDVGINVKIVTTPDTAAYEERLGAGDGDLWLEQGSQNDANPAFFIALLFWEEGIFGETSYQPLFAPGWPPGKQERLGDNTFDRLVEEALATPDEQEVKAKTAAALSQLIDEHAIIVPLAGLSRINAHAENVGGFESHPSALQIRWDGVFLTAK